MPPYQDDQQLRDAIKTTLVQLCKVGLLFQNDVCIEGTIGLTVDSKKVTLVHFDEKFTGPSVIDSGLQQQQQTQVQHLLHHQQQIAQATFTPNGNQAQDNDIDNLRLLGAEALSSLHEYLSRPLVSQSQVTELDKTETSSKDSRTFSDSTAKLLSLNETIAINLDSDEETFGDMNFEDMSEVKVKAFHQNQSAGDVKNIIVIDDNDLFNPESAPVDEGFDQESVVSSEPPPSNVSYRTMSSVTAVSSTAGDTVISAETTEHDNSTSADGGTEQAYSGFECEECSKILPSQSLLEAHLVSAHGITESSALGKIVHHTCTHCNKKFRFLASLNKHATRHLGERSHRCKLCHNSYRHQSSLEIHMEAHTNSLHCRKCNKTYNSKNLLQKHIMYMHEKAQSRTVKFPQKMGHKNSEK